MAGQRARPPRPNSRGRRTTVERESGRDHQAQRIPLQFRCRQQRQVTSRVFRPHELLQRLNAGEVQYVVVGGLAVGAWGYVRGTDDADIVPDPSSENLDRLAGVLEELDGHVVVADKVTDSSAIRLFLRTGDKTLVRTSLGEVDVLQGLPQIPRYQELVLNAEDAEYEGVQVKVCSLADLRAMKRTAGRDQDRLDLEALEIAHPEDFQGE
jgi:predicted nucleotidyltransferase